jgi:hypothetical protein
MFAALLLAAALSTPRPSAAPTPPPEPNHVTIEAAQSFVQTAGEGWQNSNGAATQLSGRYEFQASPKLRFANTVHWERLSSVWTSYQDGISLPWYFNFNEYDDEFDVELGRPDVPTGVGVGYFSYRPVSDSGNLYNLSGFGVGIDRWANYYVPRSVYASAWYYPYLKASQDSAGAYGIARVDVGLNFRASLVSPWSYRIGVQDESWFSRNANSSDLHFFGPYLSLSYWR